VVNKRTDNTKANSKGNNDTQTLQRKPVLTTTIGTYPWTTFK